MANGQVVPADVTRVHKDGAVDLETSLPRSGGDFEPLVITRSPCDPSCKLADSWHPLNPAPFPANGDSVPGGTFPANGDSVPGAGAGAGAPPAK